MSNDRNSPLLPSVCARLVARLARKPQWRNVGHYRLLFTVLAGSVLAMTSIGGLSAREPAANFGPQSVAPLAKQLTPAVVNISTTQIAKGPEGVPLPKVPNGSPFGEFFEDFFNRQDGAPRGERKAPSLGSGFVIDGKEGLIVTNNHVIEDADEIVINFADGSRRKVEKIVGRDATTDIALLKVSSPTPLPDVKFGSSSAIEVGDWVLAIGNPFGLGGSVSVGIISAKSRNINNGVYDDYLQTDAAINKGNSGGPLFNMKGEVVGINTAIISPTGGSIGIGFAVPSDTVARVVEQLKAYGATRNGWLGVRLQTVSDGVAKALGLEDVTGALVSDVTADGPAGKAGIKAGDVIVGFADAPITTARDLPKKIAETAVGARVDVEVLRSGKTRKIEVEIGLLEEPEPAVKSSAGKSKSKKPSQPSAKPKSPEPKKSSETIIGLSLRALDAALRRKHGYQPDQQGVLVDAVTGTAAAAKGVRAGVLVVQAGQIEVRTPADVAKGVSQTRSAGRRAVLLGLEDKRGNLRFIAVPLEDEQKQEDEPK